MGVVVKKKVSAAAASLLAEAGKYVVVNRKSWLARLPKEQQNAIIEAYRAMPGTDMVLIGLIKAIRKTYGVTASESAIRMTLRGLDK
jgi:hypothetical protein